MRSIPAICCSLAALLAACADDPAPVGATELGLGTTCVAIVDGVAGGVVADTYVTPRRPNRNFDGSNLQVGADGPAGRALTLVRASLAPIPAAARIESADLSLYQLTRTLQWTPLSVRKITAPWTETAVTYTSFGNAYAGVAEATANAAGRQARTHFDLTALTRGWYAGTVANHGVAVLATAGSAGFADESYGPRRRPTLTVCYSTCTDGVHNGDEAGVDCGGALCGPCVLDVDGDGFPATVDCDDHAPAVHPGAVEDCNLVDDDCDGVVDQGDPGGGAACATGNATCSAGTRHCVAGTLVCDAATGAVETCDGVDNDCDGVIDDGNPGGLVDCSHIVSFNPADPTEIGGWFYGYTSCSGGAIACLPVDTIESCDGIDNDLDGLVDEDAVQCRDADGDDSGDPRDQVPGCVPVPGYVFDCHDCNDADFDVGTFSGRLVCDPVADPAADSNCDGNLDRSNRNCT